MIGRSQASIMTGTSVLFRLASVARRAPAGLHGFLRPQDGDGFGLLQRFLGDVVIGVADSRSGPTRHRTLARERFGETPCGR
jgi:hypothetical protein